MSLRFAWTGALVLIIACVGSATSAEPASNDELRETIRRLQERVSELEAVDGLEEEKGDAAAGGEARPDVAPESPPSVSAPESPPSVSAGEESGEVPAPAEEAERAMRSGRQDPVIYREALNDRQAAAARAGDYTLDPGYRGFIPIPHTVGLIKFNARPRVDFIGDSGDTGTDFRFVPALFPASNEDGWQFGVNANGSQLRVEVVAPALEGNFRFFYQNDFFGSNSSAMSYRLQHLYGQFYGVLAGFTYGVFEDPDSWPDTVDYEGPAGLIFARRAVGQYLMQLGDDFDLTLSLEDPNHSVDTTGDPDADVSSRAPDAGFALRWTPGDWGHLRASTLARSIRVDGDDFSDDDVFGWGVNTSGSLKVTSRNTIQWLFVYGRGIGGLGNDAGFESADAAFNSAGELRPLRYWSTMVALSHAWTPRWRSTFTHSFVDLHNTDLQSGDFYHQTHYASANLVYQIFKRLSIGLEGLYGRKEVKDGRDSDVFRVQLGLSLSLFD